MGLPSCKFVSSRNCDGARGTDDCRKTPQNLRPIRNRNGYAASLIVALVALVFTDCAQAGSIRIATYHPELERKGPGILLRDIFRGEDDQIEAVVANIVQVAPDILLLTAFDYDQQLHGLNAFSDALRQKGLDYPHAFALQPNNGIPTGLDLDGDGWKGEPEDKQGFAEFSGQGGMALLSRYPILVDQAADFTRLLWSDYRNMAHPGQKQFLPIPSGSEDVLRLSSSGHWDVPIALPDGKTLRILGFHAGTPAFDTELGTNAARNRDEVEFWTRYLNNDLPFEAPRQDFVLLGDANLDSHDGQGRREAIVELLAHPLLQDPKPTSNGAVVAAQSQGGANLKQVGDPALDTADWPDDIGPGNLRVDYVLPSANLMVKDAGVHWPIPEDLETSAADNNSSRHALVWVDLWW